MNIKSSFFAFVITGVLSFSAYSATIELKDGRSLDAEIIANEDHHLLLNLDGIEVSLPKDKVASISFGDSGSVAPARTANVETNNVNQDHASTQNSVQQVEVPAGSSITVRMSESVNTRHHQSGHRFTAILESNLMAGDVIVAQRGSTVYGELSEVKKAGRVAGSATMSVTLTGIIIEDKMHDLKTDVLSSNGQNTAGDTVGKTARAAAIGGLIDGSSGAKTGAKVGVGASIITQGNDMELPKNSLIEFTLNAPLVS